MYPRILFKTIQNQIGKGKLIVVYGARQVGKTTLVKQILSEFKGESKYIDCDLLSNREVLQSEDLNILGKLVGKYRLIVIDEAQRVKNIGLGLKILHDNFPDLQVIATGSASFDLANKIQEPLTGRVLAYTLYPLSIAEISGKLDYFDLKNKLDNILKYGLYPDIFDKLENIELNLEMISSNYLYKDILEFENIKKSDQLVKILQLLALQIGSEVSFSEIGQKLGLNTVTVQKYIDLLEKSFVIYRLKSFSRNLRNEITRGQKIYFWDLGIRNSLIRNFNDKDLRTDWGNLFENFWIIERLKQNSYNLKFVNSYFWRTHAQDEIDYIEESKGKLHAYEIKWQKSKTRQISQFFQAYPETEWAIINQDNCLDSLIKP